jgi:hypothetical protein
LRNVSSSDIRSNMLTANSYYLGLSFGSSASKNCTL